MRFGSNRGRSMPAPTSTSVPRRTSWARPASIAVGLAGALEHDVDGVVDDAAGLGDGRHVERRRAGSTRVGADVGGERLAALGGLDARDVVDAQRARGRRSISAPMGPAPRTSTAVAGLDAALRDPVERDRQRLGQRGRARVEAVGHREQLVGRGDACSAANAPCSRPMPGVSAGLAQRRPAGDAHAARAAAQRRVRRRRCRRPPRVDVVADRGDHAGPLVAGQLPGCAPALEHHVQVAAADAAAARPRRARRRRRARAPEPPPRRPPRPP